MRVKFLLGLVLAVVLIAIVAMAGLAEAKEISITKAVKRSTNDRSIEPFRVYLIPFSSTFETKEFESWAAVYNGDHSASTSAVITVSANNSIAYVYMCAEGVCEDYPSGYATPNSPYTFIKYLVPSPNPGCGIQFKVLVESYGDLNHPYYGVNVTACHYTEPTNCNSKYVQGKYSGYEIG